MISLRLPCYWIPRNLYLPVPLLGRVIYLVSSAVTPWISTHNLQNNAPYSGLVNRPMIIPS